MFIKLNRVFGWLMVVAITLQFFLHMTASAQELKYGAEESFVEVHGFTDLIFQDFEADGKQNGVSTFDDFHLNVFLKSEIRQNITVIAEIEYEHGGEVLELDRSEIRLKLSEAAIVSTGRFYAPFGIERLNWYPSTNKFVSRPSPMRQIIPGNWYMTGIQLSGATSAGTMGLNYAVSLSNGLKGPKRSDRQFRDNNSNKTLIGRVGFSPIHELEIGVSYSRGKYDDKNLYALNFFGGDINFDWDDVHLLGEYVRGFVDDASGGFHRDGFYVTAAYKILNEKKAGYYLEPAIRYDKVDPNDEISDSSAQSRLTIGLNYSPYSHYLLKAEYQLIREDEGMSLSNNGVQIQVVADF